MPPARARTACSSRPRTLSRLFGNRVFDPIHRDAHHRIPQLSGLTWKMDAALSCQEAVLRRQSCMFWTAWRPSPICLTTLPNISELAVAEKRTRYFYLRRRGYTMIAWNYRSPNLRGELDLVGWHGDVLCFIEVKTQPPVPLSRPLLRSRCPIPATLVSKST